MSHTSFDEFLREFKSQLSPRERVVYAIKKLKFIVRFRWSDKR